MSWYLLCKSVKHTGSSLFTLLLYPSPPPPGLLLRMFIAFYDMEVAEEEAFLKWKEELNEDYPGKGKALFQVCIIRECVWGRQDCNISHKSNDVQTHN